MTNGGSRSRQKPDRKQSGWDKFFLAVLCAPLLPGDLGPVPLLHAACGMGAKAAAVLSAALVYSAPIVIPLLVWNALGVDRGGILVQLGWTTVRVHSSSKPAAYLLLGLASAAIQAAQLARQSAQARRRLAAAIALTPAAACERSPALGEERFGGGGGGTPDGGSQPGSFLASGPPSTQGDADDRGAVATEPAPAADQLQELLGEVSAIQKVLQGEDVAEAWAAAAQHSYRAVLFEVGRLCGEVGLQVPPSEADGDPAHLQAILHKLRAEMS